MIKTDISHYIEELHRNWNNGKLLCPEIETWALRKTMLELVTCEELFPNEKVREHLIAEVERLSKL